jgi:hypothetical protein
MEQRMEQRSAAWQRRRVPSLRSEQEAELRDLRAELPVSRQDLSGVLPSRPAGREGWFSTLQGAQSLPLVHVQGTRQRRDSG